MEYNNLICYFLCGAGGAREYGLVLVRWKNPAVCTLYALNPTGSKTTGDEIEGSSPAIASDGTVYIGSFGKNRPCVRRHVA